MQTSSQKESFESKPFSLADFVKNVPPILASERAQYSRLQMVGSVSNVQTLSVKICCSPLWLMSLLLFFCCCCWNRFWCRDRMENVLSWFSRPPKNDWRVKYWAVRSSKMKIIKNRLKMKSIFIADCATNISFNLLNRFPISSIFILFKSYARMVHCLNYNCNENTSICRNVGMLCIKF